MTRGNVLRIVLCIAALHAATAYAQDSGAPQFTLSGYGTVGAIHSDEDRADYLVDAFKPNGPGHSHSWRTDTDSRLGLQASALLTSQLSAVVQVLAQQRYDNSYRPTVEWANLKYAVTPDFSIRFGRVVLPVFMVTDTRRVGYSNPWIRPPVELYSLVPVTSNDGLDASYRFTAGGLSNTVQLTVGGSDSKFPNASGFEAGTAKVRKLLAINDSIEKGFATLRLSVGRADLTIDALRPLFDGFRQFGPAGAEIADRYSVDGRNVTFVGVGGSYDPGNWFAMAEWARFSTHSVVGNKSACYVSGGYRVKSFTPYATYARIKADSNTSDPGLPLAGLPPQVAPIAAFLNANLNEQLNLLPVQDTISAGVRWDFLKNAALKVQYDRVKLGASSRGTFGNFSPDFRPGSRVQLFSVAVDFVF
jgi:predicted porin